VCVMWCGDANSVAGVVCGCVGVCVGVRVWRATCSRVVWACVAVHTIHPPRPRPSRRYLAKWGHDPCTYMYMCQISISVLFYPKYP